MKRSERGRGGRRRPEGDRSRGTSWESSKKWYAKTVGKKGHHYHQSVVLPGIVRLLAFGDPAAASLLDLGCGQGVLAREIPASVDYWGVDSAPGLLEEARKLTQGERRRFIAGDATQPLAVEKTDFTHGAVILALQNMDNGKAAVANLGKHLRRGGRAVLVLNHPCFRIPRQSSWEIDEKNDLQYRRVNRYLNPLQIPIRMNPSQGDASPMTWTFHEPLSAIFGWLKEAGLLVETVEEWVSDKSSDGAAAKRENRAREEFPLFMAVAAVKR